MADSPTSSTGLDGQPVDSAAPAMRMAELEPAKAEASVGPENTWEGTGAKPAHRFAPTLLRDAPLLTSSGPRKESRQNGVITSGFSWSLTGAGATSNRPRDGVR